MAPEDRREAIVCAARPLLIEHGRAATTKQIADAAGVAEGTIFRVFPTKEELVEAVLDAEADTGEFLEQLDRIDLDQPLRERLVDFVSLLQQRFIGIFALMTALAVPRPPQQAPRRSRPAGRPPRRGPCGWSCPTPTPCGSRPRRWSACCGC